MDELQQIITAVTDAYEKARPALVEAGIDRGVARAVSLLEADLSLYDWRVAHKQGRT
jgi:hypothetical protein